MTHGSLVLLPTPTPACPAGVLLPPGCAPRRGPARWRGARDGPRLSAVTVRIAQSEIASAGHRPQKSRRALRAPARRKRAPGGRAARLESPEAGESPSRRAYQLPVPERPSGRKGDQNQATAGAGDKLEDSRPGRAG
ncbi:translation initiation factor IF-2-like isoform X4 [Cervus elaphus]|uniref:translation initiation factor IF-2-like isoform X3 n=1 Tax=Cervus canadensis TaxID=1574408 RepID=UPI001C9E4FFC|nr:translation initiation factor IF-2-like isoform X3 [Cervus canadensis]XP_043743743.1 translation initiation factor IF-2-like isoform X4 [Cervus elaphus]